MVVGLRSLGLWAGKITAWFRSKDERNRRRQYELAPSALKNALYSYLCAMVSALCANNTCPLSPRGRFNARVGYSCCWRRGRHGEGDAAAFGTAPRKRGAGLLEATEQRPHFSLRALLYGYQERILEEDANSDHRQHHTANRIFERLGQDGQRARGLFVLLAAPAGTWGVLANCVKKAWRRPA